MNPAEPPTPSSAPKSKKKMLLVWLAIALAVVTAGDIALLSAKQHKHAPHAPSVTLYYNDGKTVLWQNANPAVEPTTQPAHAPYFVDLVRAELQQRFGTHYYEQGSWAVTTTLNAHLQATAEKLVADNLPAITSHTGGRADEEATVLEDVTTGQINALVGGTDRSNPNYGLINFATTPLAPGSSIKPFTYAALINSTSAGAGSAVNDTQGPLPGWPCTDKTQPSAAAVAGNCLWNYDYTYASTMPLRYALGTNRNVPAVQAGMAVGVQKVIDLIGSMGAVDGYNCYASADFSQKTQCYGAALLGDGAYLTLADETHALATLANGGEKVPQTTIVSIRLNDKPKLSWQQPAGQRVLKADTAYIINDILSDPSASYLPGSCTATDCSSLADGGYKFQHENGWKFAVDVGVSYGNHSALMASWSSKYAVASWVGNHAQNTSIASGAGLSSEALAEPLTRGLMQAAHADMPAANWRQPSDIQTLPAAILTHQITSGDVIPSSSSDIYPNWYKP